MDNYNSSGIVEKLGKPNSNTKQTDELRNNTRNPTSSILKNNEIQSLESGYIFNEKGVPLSKDDRTLTARQREIVPNFSASIVIVPSIGNITRCI